MYYLKFLYKALNMNAPENQKETLELFKQGITILENALTGLSDIDLDYVPINGGWSIRQIVHHISDGDDLWKACIKIALGNEQGEFSLKWYLALPQTEWAKKWSYETRSIATSLELLKANRNHILQLLESETNRDTSEDKFSRFDLLVENHKKQLLLIEIQNQREFDYFHNDFSCCLIVP